MNITQILTDGLVLNSTGTTGTPKKIYQSPQKLLENIKNEIDIFKITDKSHILNCSPLSHITAYYVSLTGLFVGSKVTQKEMSYEEYLDFLITSKHPITHTVVPPLTLKNIMADSRFEKLEFSNTFVIFGKNFVTKEDVRTWIKKGAWVITNWGMSEIGPLCCYSIFKTEDDLDSIWQLEDKVCMGNKLTIEAKIVDGEWVVRGNSSIYRDWFFTNDRMFEHCGTYYYEGRI
jgi:acyl-CoA synthetase (AMP-forming)/AMP-acid ligase II